ncbi:EAL domain-containing protein [Pseudoalteromonas sp. SS15]|uniref:EAL domain-containing protein n=1 Tax=Pseudoalteromonas sp. SS15 TaxID=3139393 RepID=UPI003BAA121F
MFTLSQFIMSTKLWGKVIVTIRLEKIVSPPNTCKNSEVLCAIRCGDFYIEPQLFFKNLNSFEHMLLFKRVLESIDNSELDGCVTFSINTPIEVLSQGDEIFTALLGVGHRKVALELMECDIEKYGDREYAVINKLSEMKHISIWLDDFGAGSSNFDILIAKKIRIDSVKVAKELFWELMKSDTAFLASFLKHLRKSYNVIVEGVETKEQYDFICAFTGVKAQGYYFLTDSELVHE